MFYKLRFFITVCIIVIDASGTTFELLVKGTSFRGSVLLNFSLCYWTSMLKSPSAIILKWILEYTIFILLVLIIWLPRIVIAPATMQFVLTVRKGDFFSPTPLKASYDFFLNFSISIIWDRKIFSKRRVSLSLNTLSFSLSMV